MYPETAQIKRTESGGLHFQGDPETGDTGHAAQERLPMPEMRAAVQDCADFAGGAIVAGHSRSGLGGMATALPSGGFVPHARTHTGGNPLGKGGLTKMWVPRFFAIRSL